MTVTQELIKNIARVTRTNEKDLTPQTELKTIRADSLHWVQVIAAVENTLGIEVDIDREKMAAMKTIADFAGYIEGFTR